MAGDNLTDLEQLLEDLGRPKSVAPAKKTRSSVVNLNELEELMSDLAQPPAPRGTYSKPSPASATASVNLSVAAPTPAKANKPPARLSVASTSLEVDDLDSIMDALNGDLDPKPKEYHHPPAQVNTPHSQPESEYDEPPPERVQSYIAPAAPAPAPAPAFVPAQAPPASRPTSTNTIDELEELLNGLEDTRSSVRLPVAPKPANNSYNSTPAYPPSQPPAVTPSFSANNSSNSFLNSRVVAPPQPQQPPRDFAPAPVQPRPFVPANNYSQPEQRPFVAKPPAGRPLQDPASLDSLLNDFQEQLMRAPDPNTPTAHGACASCGRSILGEVISALGRRYHPEHFTCGNCQTPLGTSNFYEQDGVPHCERCYQELLCPRCAHCDEPILDRCITALGKKWHTEHFICSNCLSPFHSGSFFERDGRPFCEACFATAFAPRCGGCNQPVRGECINALGQAWHPEHFVCQFCQKAFKGSFFDLGGKPYCDVHYHQQTNSLCAGCSEPVSGKCVDALGKKWHPEHFICAFCLNPLAAGEFTENNNRAYCKPCHGKLFG